VEGKLRQTKMKRKGGTKRQCLKKNSKWGGDGGGTLRERESEEPVDPLMIVETADQPQVDTQPKRRQGSEILVLKKRKKNLRIQKGNADHNPKSRKEYKN